MFFWYHKEQLWSKLFFSPVLIQNTAQKVVDNCHTLFFTPTLTASLSMADNHLHGLHKFLPGSEAYLEKTVVEELSPNDDPRKVITKRQDYLLRQKAVHDNGHIVDWFAHEKLRLLREKILEPHLGMMDYIVRCEYQARSAIHFHLIGRCSGIDLHTMEEAFGPNMIDGQLNTEKEYFCKKVTKFGVETLGISACHPESEVKDWPPPLGLNFLAPSTNALRNTLTKAASVPGGLQQDLVHLTNRVMLHKCKKIYCFPAGSKKKDCRFRFPFKRFGFKQLPTIDEVDETTGEPTGEQYTPVERQAGVATSGMEIDEYGDLRYLRNHPWLVEHIPELLSVWRGNIDAKVIKNQATLINYLVKYVVKAENNSQTFGEILKRISESNNDDDETSVKKAMQKILLSIVKEHDISKNEAFKIVSKNNYVFYSRPFAFINMTDKRRMNVEACQDDNNEGRVKLAKNAADQYWTRDSDPNYLKACEHWDENPNSMPENPRTVSLNTYAALYTTGWRFTGLLKVPVPTPQYVYVPHKQKRPEVFQNYCEINLLLHKPGSNPTNLLMKDYNDPDSECFVSAEEALLDFVNDPNSPCPDAVRFEFLKGLEEQLSKDSAGAAGDGEDNIDILVPDPVEGEDEEYEDGELEPGLFDCFMAPETEAERIEMDRMVSEDTEQAVTILTHDKNHNWQEDRHHPNMKSVKDSVNWLKEQKEIFVLEEDRSRLDVNSLNRNQKWVHDAAMSAMSGGQKLIDVCGGAGTGKSYTVNCIIKSAKEKFGEEGNHVAVIAPTGAAASQFTGGKTIHSFLKLGVKKRKKKQQAVKNKYGNLSDTAAQDLERQLDGVKLIVIDEKSMMGRPMLEAIDRRLKQARPRARDQPFGGISIMIVGDFRQLPPVGESPLYLRDAEGTTPEDVIGGQLYEKFDEETYILTEQMRQRDARFIAEMDSLGNRTFTTAAYDRWLASMDLGRMSPERQKLFNETATKLCGKKRDMGDFNEKGIQRLNKPICRSLAKNNCSMAKSGSLEDADNLQPEMFFAKGAKVVLTKNLWSEAGLVNGSQGIIKYIVYEEGNEASEDSMPDMLLVHFPGYKGPSFLGPDEETVVPIFPVTTEWFNGKHRLSRTQFPLHYGYAITIHRAQGEFSLI